MPQFQPINNPYRNYAPHHDVFARPFVSKYNIHTHRITQKAFSFLRVFIRARLRDTIAAHDRIDKLLIAEHLAAPRAAHATFAKRPPPAEAGDDLVHLGRRERALAGLGRCAQQRVAELGEVHLSAVVVVEGRERRQQFRRRRQRD